MRTRVGSGWLITLCVALAGCGQPEPPKRETVTAVVAEPEAPRDVFPFTSTNQTVTRRDIRLTAETPSVTADFNHDGLADIAVASESPGGENTITLYVQKPASAAGGETEYYRAGSIPNATDGRIIGLMSRKREEFADLILLVTRTNRPNEMLRYYNDGSGFHPGQAPKKSVSVEP